MYVYFILNPTTGHFKIGKTKNSIENRIKQLQTGNETELVLARSINYENPEIEKYLHEYYKDKRLHGEWFNVTLDEIDHTIKVIKDFYTKENTVTYSDPRDTKLCVRLDKWLDKKKTTYPINYPITVKQFFLGSLVFWILLMIMRYYWRTF